MKTNRLLAAHEARALCEIGLNMSHAFQDVRTWHEMKNGGILAMLAENLLARVPSMAADGKRCVSTTFTERGQEVAVRDMFLQLWSQVRQGRGVTPMLAFPQMLADEFRALPGVCAFIDAVVEAGYSVRIDASIASCTPDVFGKTVTGSIDVTLSWDDRPESGD